jgi:hypothetical protein
MRKYYVIDSKTKKVTTTSKANTRDPLRYGEICATTTMQSLLTKHKRITAEVKP